MAKSTKQKIKSIINPKKTLINLKVSPAEMKAIQENATKYAGGNYSAWLRYAGMNFKPSKSELVKKEVIDA